MVDVNGELFLGRCEVVDWHHESVRELAHALTRDKSGPELVRVLFEWVCDRIAHTADAGGGSVTLSASQVLREGTGLCYAKSHLLTALLRACGVPAGLCYQRLRDDSGGSFVLHGLVGVCQPDGTFLRIDPRGNKPGVDARFAPGGEALAFIPELPGEVDLPGVFARPVPSVVAALSLGGDFASTLARLPDVAPEGWPVGDAPWARGAPR